MVIHGEVKKHFLLIFETKERLGKACFHIAVWPQGLCVTNNAINVKFIRD